MISYFVYYCYGASRTPKRGTSRCVSDTLWFLSFIRDSFNKHLWNFSLLLPESTKLLSGMFRENAEGVLNFYDALAQLLSLKIWKGIDFERPFTIASFPARNERYLLTPCETTAGTIKVSQTSEALSGKPRSRERMENKIKQASKW